MIYGRPLNNTVVLFIYNRPNLTRGLFEILREVKPRKLLIVADGPKAGSEIDQKLCRDARASVESVPWECEVIRNYSDTNLGLKERIVSGLKWVFELEERAIILEDDCHPSRSFFSFCDQLLELYSHNEKVGMIQGGSFGDTRSLSDSYYFSNRPKIWGWATWRRVHELYEPNLDTWKRLDYVGQLALLRNRGLSTAGARSTIRTLDRVDSIGTWDYQWVVSMWLNGLTSATPRVNLVKNNGFGGAATHTVFESLSADLPSYTLTEPLSHPKNVEPNLEIDASESKQRLKRWLRNIILHPFKSFAKFARYANNLAKRALVGRKIE